MGRLPDNTMPDCDSEEDIAEEVEEVKIVKEPPPRHFIGTISHMNKRLNSGPLIANEETNDPELS